MIDDPPPTRCEGCGAEQAYIRHVLFIDHMPMLVCKRCHGAGAVELAKRLGPDGKPLD